jgi:hypothetical protein
MLSLVEAATIEHGGAVFYQSPILAAQENMDAFFTPMVYNARKKNCFLSKF